MGTWPSSFNPGPRACSFQAVGSFSQSPAGLEMRNRGLLMVVVTKEVHGPGRRLKKVVILSFA